MLLTNVQECINKDWFEGVKKKTVFNHVIVILQIIKFRRIYSFRVVVCKINSAFHFVSPPTSVCL